MTREKARRRSVERQRKQWKARPHQSLPSFMQGPLLQRHPYIAAHDAFVQGKITLAQAAALAATDREFIAEFELGELTGRYEDASVFDAAMRVVRDQWRPELVKAIQGSKAQ